MRLTCQPFFKDKHNLLSYTWTKNKKSRQDESHDELGRNRRLAYQTQESVFGDSGKPWRWLRQELKIQQLRSLVEKAADTVTVPASCGNDPLNHTKPPGHSKPQAQDVRPDSR